MPRFSFVLCTFHREILLVEALHSILAMDGRDGVELEIIVTDNSDTETARDVIADFNRKTGFSVQYLTSHPANISLARNTGIAAATGDIVAIIDDDMQVQKGWLRSVIETIETRDFDVLFGPVGPVFEEPAAASPEAVAMFRRTLDLPKGTELHSYGRNRTRGFALATSNSVFRRARCFDGTVPFDADFGVSGGEDLDLFCRLERAGLRLGWVPGAGTTEFVPRHRCRIDYLKRRHYVGGQVYAAVQVRNSPVPLLTASGIMARAVVQLALLGLTAVRVHSSGSRQARDHVATRLAGCLGKLTWRRLQPLYQEERQRFVAPTGG